MDYKAPIAKRTRSKRDEALLKIYWEKKANNEWGDAGTFKERRRYECTSNSGSKGGESSTRENREKGKLGRRERDAVGVKRKSSSGVYLVDSDDEDDEVVVSVSEERDDDVDESEEEEEDVPPAAKDDSREETLFLTDEETEEEDDDEEYASLSEIDTSEDENEEELELTEKSEKAKDKVEIGLKRKKNANGGDLHTSSNHDIGDKSKKSGNEETIEVGAKGKAIDDGDGLRSSATLDTDVRSEKVRKEGSVGIGFKENLIANGDAVLSSSSHDVDERSVQVGKVDSVLEKEKDECENGNYDGEVVREDNVSPEENIECEIVSVGNENGDRNDLQSFSVHRINDRCDNVSPGENIECEIVSVGNENGDRNDLQSFSVHRINDRCDNVSPGENIECEIVSVGNENGDRNDLQSFSVHRINDRCDNVGKEKSVFAEEKTSFINRRGGNSDGKMWKEQNAAGVGSVGYGNGDRDDPHTSSVQMTTDRCDNVRKANTVFADNRKHDVRDTYETGSEKVRRARGRKAWTDKKNLVHRDGQNSEGVSSLAGPKSTKRPRAKWLPTVEFVAPNIEHLPHQWSLAEPQTVIEISEQDREIDALFFQFISIDMEDANGSTTDSKAAEDNLARSDNDSAKNKTCVGKPGMEINEGKIHELQTTFKRNEAAGENNLIRFDHDSAKNKTYVGKPGMEFNEGKIHELQTTFKKNEVAIGDSFTSSIYDVIATNHASTSENTSKMSRKTAPKASNAFTILVDSIYRDEVSEDEEVSEKQIVPLESEAPKSKRPESLPQLFSIADPPSPAPEKSAFEKELDEMYDVFDFIRTSEEIGHTDHNRVEDDDLVPPGTKPTQIMLCRQGKHHIILDEEVGLFCEFCPHVEREIKYVLPGFVPYPYGFGEKRKYDEEEEEEGRSIFNDIHCNVPEDCGTDSDAHAEGTVWDLIPGVENDMYPHQREGFEFIWSHIAGGIELGKLAKPSAYEGDGCIISHAPGTGKTRLTIVFIQSYMKFNPKSRPLIVAPRTMLLTWEEEFKKWGFDIPFHNINNLELSGKEDAAACNLVKDVKSADKVNAIRIVKLKSWIKSKSILGISYTLFEKICKAPNKEKKRQLGERKKYEFEQMGKLLLDFPGLVVFDEGHNPRSEQSYSWNALLRIKTKRRILLSGTPFQNNFDELDNTIHLVRPETTVCLGAGDKKIQGRKANAADIAIENIKRATVIREMISPFVHVYKGTILQDKLPGLRNSVVVLEPTELQQRFSVRAQMITNPFQYELLEAKISIHPSLLILDKSKESSTLSSEDEKYADDMVRLEQIKLSPEGGVKAKFTIDLIRYCQPLNERVLIFSQWIDPLTLMRDILKSQFQWTEGVEIVYMDGKVDGKQRQSSMSYFNNPSSKAKVLLASTKSCNEGINLVGASRVVLLDVTWNPAVERQAISRAYRLGQKKIVFIYHLLMAGAREEQKYSRQVEKHRLSELVFSCSSKEADAKNIRAAVAEDKILEEMVQHDKLKHIFQKITLLDVASYLDDQFESDRV